MPTSRSERCSCMTSWTSQCNENGASTSAWPRLARSRTTSPLQTSASRSSSTGTAGSEVGPLGSLMRTTLCSVFTPVSSPAVPSLNSNTTGAVLLNRNRWRQRSRTARDHIPAACAQLESESLKARFRPGRCGTRRGRARYRDIGQPGLGLQPWVDRRLARRTRPSLPLTAMPPPGSAAARSVDWGRPGGPEVCPSFTSTSNPPQRRSNFGPVPRSLHASAATALARLARSFSPVLPPESSCPDR